MQSGMQLPLERPIASLLAVLACLGAIVGCGSSSDGDNSASSPSQAALVPWPLFGRVPERTHYLPAKERFLDPPLKEAWSINTHALIEFPPAIANGVAYVVNKYGNAKAVRLRRSQGPLGTEHRSAGQGQTDRRDRAGLPRRQVFFAYVDGDLVAVDAQSGVERSGSASCVGHLESSPMAVGGTLYLGTDKTNVVAVRASDGKVLWQFNSPAAIKASPSFHDGRLYVADYESVDVLPRRQGRQADLAHQHHARHRPSARAASSPRRRSPSAASTPPATTAPSLPSTRRPARSTGPSRPTTSSTARRPSPGPRHAAECLHRLLRRAPLRARRRAAAGSAGATTSADRYPAPRP